VRLNWIKKHEIDQNDYQREGKLTFNKWNIVKNIFKGWLFVREYLLGNAAIARGLLEAGVGLVAGYPGTPSSEIVETLVDLKGDMPLHVEWSVNEKVALEVAAGGSWTGVRAAATMKHVGLNVAADPFMTLAYLGVGAGLVLISADDPNCHSSQNEQDSRRYAQFASVPCLDPADPQEARDMAAFGFELSERFNIPVMLSPRRVYRMPGQMCSSASPSRSAKAPDSSRTLRDAWPCRCMPGRCIMSWSGSSPR